MSNYSPETQPLSEAEIRERMRIYRDHTLTPEARLVARDRIVTSNTGMRYKLAAIFMRHYKSPAFDIDDVAQAGVEGELEAIERFDLAFTTKYMTYAGWWINQSMRQFCQEANCTVRRSIHAQQLRTEFLKLQADGLNDAEATEMMGVGNKRKLTLGNALASVVNFSDYPWTEKPFDPECRDGESDLERAEYLEPMRLALAKLHPRSRQVLVMTSEGRMLREIGAELGITKERVRQIRVTAIERLRGIMGLPADLLPAAKPPEPIEQDCIRCGASFLRTPNQVRKKHKRCPKCQKLHIWVRNYRKRQEATA